MEKQETIAKNLINAFDKKEKIFAEKQVPEALKSNYITSKKEHALLLTLLVSIDYQKDADKLWDEGRRLFESKETNWIFHPEIVIGKKYYELIKIFENEFGGAKFQDPHIWYKICFTLHNDFNDDPLEILKINNYDAIKVLNYLDNNGKKFPYLKGKKIGPLWLRMLSDYVGIDLKNKDKVPIPVDVHIANASYHMGLIKEYSGEVNAKTRKEVQAVWRTIASKIDGKIALDFDEPLWVLSHDGCSKSRGKACPLVKCNKCPVERYCIKNGTTNKV